MRFFFFIFKMVPRESKGEIDKALLCISKHYRMVTFPTDGRTAFMAPPRFLSPELFNARLLLNEVTLNNTQYNKKCAVKLFEVWTQAKTAKMERCALTANADSLQDLCCRLTKPLRKLLTLGSENYLPK